jgi:PadR family transcriptional regulator, regulatory protein PadR
MSTPMYSTELVKGTLKTIILSLLKENARLYGYEMTQRVKILSGDRIQITEGALYPLLHKLEADGIVKTELEYIGKRPRKYYSLTKDGNAKTVQMIDEIIDFMQTIKSIIGTQSAPSHANG